MKKIDTDVWKIYKFGELIQEIYKGKAYALKELELVNSNTDKSIKHISRTELNNGCDCYAIEQESMDIEDGNAITIGDTTSTIFYQPDKFICGDHMIIIRADWLNEYTGLFICTMLKQERYRYSYGRAYIRKHVKNTKIKLPSKSDGNPDWKYIEDFIKSLHCKPITTMNSRRNMPLPIHSWKMFNISKWFELDTTTLSIKTDLEEGSIPFVSRTSENNGVDGYVEADKSTITSGNCITVGAEGIYAFYQKSEFATGNKIYTMRNEHLNKYNALFICTVLNKEAYRYSYGRARILKKLSNETILLPSNQNGEPDWQYMEDYIKSLPYGDRI